MALPEEFIPPSAVFLEGVTKAQRNLHAFIVSILRNAVDADDVLQETNLVLWRKASEFDPARPFMPWALRIAQLQAMAFLKQKRQSNRVAFSEELLSLVAEESIAEVSEQEARRIALAGCLQKLPEHQRSLIAQRYQPGGSVNAIAQERNTAPKALSEMLRRIRTSLMKCIERTTTREAGR
jgi:RNA polymerase sigma-70 factor (ECF subfamily)